MWHIQIIETEMTKMFTKGQHVFDAKGKLHIIKRVNKNGTVRVQFWNRNEVLVECTCKAEEFTA